MLPTSSGSAKYGERLEYDHVMAERSDEASHPLEAARRLRVRWLEGETTLGGWIYFRDSFGVEIVARAPLADLLSTFTASWTLSELGATRHVDSGAVRGYVQALIQPSGGFRGGLWDVSDDVEYTFYGLACMALVFDLP